MLRTIPHLLLLCARAHRGLTAQRLRDLGLASGEELVLAELWQRDGLTQTELAGRLALRRPTVTTVLRTMERRGLVTRAADPRDGRILRVHPTERAAQLRPAVEEIWRAAEAELLRQLDGSEAAALQALLERTERAQDAG